MKKKSYWNSCPALWQYPKKLMDKGICTALDLAQLNAHLVKKNYNVLLMRTVMELQGIPCGGLE
jgi:DNA polymerase V